MPISRLTLIILLAVGALALACSSSSGDGGGDGGCVDSLCTAGETTCMADGVYAATCKADGLAWSVSRCDSGTLCVDGACAASPCAPGSSECVDEASARACDALGSAFGEPASCEEGAACLESVGMCVPETCYAGDAACGVDYIAACSLSGAGWEKQPCDPGQHCVQIEGEAPACVEDVCAPMDRRCQDLASYTICAADGSGWGEPVACGGGDACVDGFCFDTICVPEPEPVEDTGGGDEDVIEDTAAGDAVLDGGRPDTSVEEDVEEELPPLDPINTGGATMNGEVTPFTLNHSAKYVAEEELLTLSMNELVGVLQYQFEIHLAPIPEFSVGEWTSEDPTETSGFIFLNDGTGDPEAGAESFKFAASDYIIVVDEFGNVGGRIKGTFSGTLVSKDGTETLVVTDGYFDIKRKN